MPRNVEYLRRAPEPRPRTRKPRTATQDVGSWAFRNRWNLLPYGVVLAVVVSAHLWALVPVPELVSRLIPAGIGLGIALALRFTDVIPKLNRGIERWYLSGVSVVSGTWITVSTWYQSIPSGRMVISAVGIGTVLAVPWWYHRRIRNRVRVSYGELTGTARKNARRQAYSIVNGWYHAMGNASAVGTELAGINFGHWSVSIDVVSHGSMTLGELRKRCAKFETALDARRDSARVEALGERARSARVRFMLSDPLAQPDRVGTPDGTGMILLGKSEIGSDVRIDVTKHTLVAGRSGSGKTGLVHIAIRAMSRIPWVAMVGIDAQPGAVEFGPWSGAMAALATGEAEASDVLDQVIMGMENRGEIMKARGWRNWKPTPEEPHVCVVVDEIQVLVRAKLDEKIVYLAELMRKFGGSLFIATQYPKDQYLPVKVKEQMVYAIGLRTETPTADRVIFGEDAKDVGWNAHKLPAKEPGYFYIKGGGFDTPVICRTDWLDDVELERSQKTAPPATAVDTPTWGVLALRQPEPPVRPGIEGYEDGDVIEAVEVPQSPRDRVLWAVQPTVTHRTKIEEETGFDQKTVDKYLKILMSEEPAKVVKVGPAKYRRA